MPKSILDRFPQVLGQPMAMAMLCTVLLDREMYDDAFALGDAAVGSAPNDLAVRDLVASTLGRRVPKWHVPMLHDQRRNECYAEALRRTIRPGMTVLEIGSGAGFLALTAARLGAKVYTCEANPIVAAAARYIAEINGYADQIRVIPKLSSALELGTDLPVRADLLMSELFDDTLFGDGIVSFIAEAKQRFLTPEAIILPQRAELRLRLVQYSTPAKLLPLGFVDGFDLSAFNVLSPKASQHLRVAKIGAAPRSEAISVLSKDFSDVVPFGNDEARVTLASCGGAISGISQWLRIVFFEDLVFENDPESLPRSHWGSPVTPFVSERITRAGEKVNLRVRRVDRELLYDLQSV